MALPALVAREGLSIVAWDHEWDLECQVWQVRVRWSDGLIQWAWFTPAEVANLDILHRVRALLP